jgi:hypothetical protein
MSSPSAVSSDRSMMSLDPSVTHSSTRTSTSSDGGDSSKSGRSMRTKQPSRGEEEKIRVYQNCAVIPVEMASDATSLLHDLFLRGYYFDPKTMLKEERIDPKNPDNRDIYTWPAITKDDKVFEQGTTQQGTPHTIVQYLKSIDTKVKVRSIHHSGSIDDRLSTFFAETSSPSELMKDAMTLARKLFTLGYHFDPTQRIVIGSYSWPSITREEEPGSTILFELGGAQTILEYLGSINPDVIYRPVPIDKTKLINKQVYAFYEQSKFPRDTLEALIPILRELLTQGCTLDPQSRIECGEDSWPGIVKDGISYELGGAKNVIEYLQNIPIVSFTPAASPKGKLTPKGKQGSKSNLFASVGHSPSSSSPGHSLSSRSDIPPLQLVTQVSSTPSPASSPSPSASPSPALPASSSPPPTNTPPTTPSPSLDEAAHPSTKKRIFEFLTKK